MRFTPLLVASLAFPAVIAVPHHLHPRIGISFQQLPDFGSIPESTAEPTTAEAPVGTTIDTATITLDTTLDPTAEPPPVESPVDSLVHTIATTLSPTLDPASEHPTVEIPIVTTFYTDAVTLNPPVDPTSEATAEPTTTETSADTLFNPTRVIIEPALEPTLEPTAELARITAPVETVVNTSTITLDTIPEPTTAEAPKDTPVTTATVTLDSTSETPAVEAPTDTLSDTRVVTPEFTPNPTSSFDASTGTYYDTGHEGAYGGASHPRSASKGYNGVNSAGGAYTGTGHSASYDVATKTISTTCTESTTFSQFILTTANPYGGSYTASVEVSTILATKIYTVTKCPTYDEPCLVGSMATNVETIFTTVPCTEPTQIAKGPAYSLKPYPGEECSDDGAVYVSAPCACKGGVSYVPKKCADDSCDGLVVYKPQVGSKTGIDTIVYIAKPCSGDECAEGDVVFKPEEEEPSDSAISYGSGSSSYSPDSGSESGSSDNSGSGDHTVTPSSSDVPESGSESGSGPGSGTSHDAGHDSDSNNSGSGSYGSYNVTKTQSPGSSSKPTTIPSSDPISSALSSVAASGYNPASATITVSGATTSYISTLVLTFGVFFALV